MSHDPRAARPDDHPQLPMSALRAPVPLARSFEAAQRDALARGHVPQGDDPWFIFSEGDWLHVHRAGSGEAIYAVHLDPVAGGTHRVAEAWMTADARVQPRRPP